MLKLPVGRHRKHTILDAIARKVRAVRDEWNYALTSPLPYAEIG